MSSSDSALCFSWSKEEFSLRELLANYGDLLPFPVLVRHGCAWKEGRERSVRTGQVRELNDV